MSVQVWSPGNALVAPTVICHSADATALRAHIAAVGIAVDAYEIAPNGAAYLDLLHSFLAIRASNNSWVPDGSSGLNVDSAWIVRNMQRLAYALTKWDDNAAMGAISFLLKHQAALHPQQVRFIQFCEGFVVKVVRRMLWGSPVVLSWPPQTNARFWWQLSSDLAHEIGVQHSDLKNVFHGVVPDAVLALSIWMSRLQTRFNSHLFGVTRQTAMLEASALCAALAAIHHSHGRYSLTVLFCHRAADLLFTSICADQNLIDFTKAGGEGALTVAVRGETKLSLMNCHEALESASIILSNSARRSLLFDLNAMRNRLLLTHAVGSPSATETKKCLTNVVALLKLQGGPAWQAAYSEYRTGFTLPATALFELSDGLMQTIQTL